MSNSAEKLKERLKERGKEVKEKEPVKVSSLKKADIEKLTLQMLKDFGYVSE